MSTHETVNGRPGARHRHNGNAGPASAACPFCGAPVTTAEFREIRERMEAEENARIARTEAALKEQFTRQMAQAEAGRKAAIEKATKEATKVTDAKLKLLLANQEATISQRLQAQREASEKKLNEAVAAERTKAYGERMKLDAQLADLQRKLQAKTPHQLGEPAEVDLYEALEAAFPDDRVSRVVKGQKGPDVIVEVFHHEVLAGSIVIDSKNVSRWSNAFVAKIKADQIAEGADFGILSLSSTAFPAGERQLAIREGVIIAHPERVVAVVHLLRRQIIQSHTLKLSAEDRDEKADRLLAYITSVEASDLFDRLHKAAEGLINLDVHEVTSHQTLWRKRGELIRVVQKTHDDLQIAIDGIIGGTVAMAEGVAA